MNTPLKEQAYFWIIKSERLYYYPANWRLLRKIGIKAAQWSDAEIEIARKKDGYLGIKNEVKCYVKEV
jgi:hypothetical protein